VTNDFGRWLSGQLARREMSMTGFAKRIGVSHSSVSLWIDGKRTPSPRSCDAIADIFLISVDEVLTRAGHRPAVMQDDLDRFHARIDPLVMRLDGRDRDAVVALAETLARAAATRSARKGETSRESPDRSSARHPVAPTGESPGLARSR